MNLFAISVHKSYIGIGIGIGMHACIVIVVLFGSLVRRPPPPAELAATPENQGQTIIISINNLINTNFCRRLLFSGCWFLWQESFWRRFARLQPSPSPADDGQEKHWLLVTRG
jgi:hypothetical protein